MIDFSTFDSIVLWDGVNKPHPEIHCDNEFPDQPYFIAERNKPCQLGDDCYVKNYPDRFDLHHKCAKRILEDMDVYVCECSNCSPRYNFYYRSRDSRGVRCYWCWKGLCKKP